MLKSENEKSVVVLVSGGGTNLQALIDAYESEGLGGGKITCVISSKEDAFALKRAEKHGIRTKVVNRKSFTETSEFQACLLNALDEENPDLIVLAGFLSVLSKDIVNKYENKIINVHPSLIPSFCGDGFYGLRVHKAALDYGVKITGATVFFVNEITDGGKIILQKAVEVKDGDTPETLQRRVMEEGEWDLLPKVVRMICDDKHC